jgi:hypothetical protein
MRWPFRRRSGLDPELDDMFDALTVDLDRCVLLQRRAAAKFPDVTFRAWAPTGPAGARASVAWVNGPTVEAVRKAVRARRADVLQRLPSWTVLMAFLVDRHVRSDTSPLPDAATIADFDPLGLPADVRQVAQLLVELSGKNPQHAMTFWDRDVCWAQEYVAQSAEGVAAAADVNLVCEI